MGENETGATGAAWTRREVELVVSVYLHMLRMQLMGGKVSGTISRTEAEQKANKNRERIKS